MAAELIRELLNQAGITIDGPAPWDVRVHDDRFHTRLLRDRNLGLGESYMDGWWDCDQLDEMIRRLLLADLEGAVRSSLLHLLRFLPAYLFNLQTPRRVRAIAHQHYNLDNELFFSFLDPYKQYSCAYFSGTDELDRAQRNKLALIGSKLDLSDKDHLLDIGCGWGGLAKYCAEHFGATVTGLNISREQMLFAREFCKGLPVHLEERDYRDIEGAFDKIVSVGMFEHVGVRNYDAFFAVAHRCLRQDGYFLLHTIGRNCSGRGADPWLTKYIFPNSMLPSLAQIATAAENSFVIEDVHNLGPHYARTLTAWNARFQRAWPRLQHKYDDRFRRMWSFYLLSCAGAFQARSIQLWQVAMTRERSGAPQPPARAPVS